MIIQAHDKFLTVDMCNHLIDFYKNNKNLSFAFGHEGFFPRWPLELPQDTTEFKFLQDKLNEKGMYVNNSIVEYVQIVRWPVGSKQNPHYDTAQEHTTLASIIYLNNNFIGGETYFTDGITFTPKQGRLIIFDGQYYEHGVNDVSKNERYVVAAWYKNKTIKVY
tara:strand:+ start:272 stop:763 length:492 start_codon:yes stop_codon:yes gene_type:complete